jgi:AcrR family transcriptional regulator
MPGRPSLDLPADQIIRAAVEIFEEQGLDAVSMRTVSNRLGVSPVPVYKRIGNKDALLDAMAEALLARIVPVYTPDQPWQSYAFDWAMALRDRLSRTPDVRLLVGPRRSAFVEASRPLVESLRAAGFARDAAVQACRLLTWAIVGFVVVENDRPKRDLSSSPGRLPGADPSGVSTAEANELFRLHVRYLIDGLKSDAPTPVLDQ